MASEFEGMAFESAVPNMEQTMEQCDTYAMSDPQPSTVTMAEAYPDAMIPMKEDDKQKLLIWLDKWLNVLYSSHQTKVNQWAQEEEDYRALSEQGKTIPFEGACGDKIPAIAMAVDPIQARLSTGIFKADPVFKFKGLKKGTVEFAYALEQFVEYYQKHIWKFRQISSPRLLEFTKHGTMAYKVIYEREEYEAMTYDANWKVTKTKVLRKKGPSFVGVSIDNLLFPPYYQFVQDCPIIAERVRLTEGQLRVAEASNKITNVDKILGNTVAFRDQFEMEQARSANLQDPIPENFLYELYECWFDYDCNGDGLPEKMVATFHWPTKTLLQLRYNWYFHQKKPYVVIPYTIAANTLYGLGLAEMVKPFQDQLTSWHRLAMDNAYLANIRMFISSKDSGIENRPKIYAGRVFRVDDPKKDLIPFQMADIYPSTTYERQNLFGLAEKRTGVSDYLTGRESPIIGSRATATSTMALISEGTKRVEEVLENIRNGYSEMLEMAISIWIQYGLDGVDDVIFSDDDTGQLIKKFFNNVDASNVNGAVAIDLAVSDAANNRVAQQQMQLAIIQVMMTYLQKVIELAQMAAGAVQTMPAMVDLAEEVSDAARAMFKDLLQTYNIRNPETYLPDLDKFIEDLKGGRAQPSDISGLVGGIGGQSGVQGVPSGPAGVPIGMPMSAGNGGGPPQAPVPTRPGEGLQ
ncbi:hypothetical protein UFOVP915_5 [uncultured Caudovirales phage]|uniref:Portal protein n=1 Tax=uncultured Caudovirales phage TaxID=2100421 RepID=A0A6J5PUT3_9CAUD|nr:hypothetical protein UFOVP825_23 [uncultured Caudovirales phage]CAB4171174.1 hypothetical protein UFOVP915_5 [uncultured Caudovirales phage]